MGYAKSARRSTDGTGGGRWQGSLSRDCGDAPWQFGHWSGRDEATRERAWWDIATDQCKPRYSRRDRHSCPVLDSPRTACHRVTIKVEEKLVHIVRDWLMPLVAAFLAWLPLEQ